jgi:Rad3-related DNA helicase
MEEERGGGMKIFCTSDDRAEALKKVLSENEEIPETLKIETLTMAHHPRDRHLIAEKWNSGQCKMIIAYYGVGESK